MWCCALMYSRCPELMVPASTNLFSELSGCSVLFAGREQHKIQFLQLSLRCQLRVILKCAVVHSLRNLTAVLGKAGRLAFPPKSLRNPQSHSICEQ